MAWYSKQGFVRRRQIWADLSLVAWIALWSIAAVYASAAIANLATPLRATRQTAEGMRDHLHDAAVGAGTLPVGGGQLRPPLDMLGQDVNGLVASLNSQIRAIETLSTMVAIALVVVPTLAYLVTWLPKRWRTTRPPAVESGDAVATAASRTPSKAEASRASASLSAAERLAALRAVAMADPESLYAITPDPVRALDSGDPALLRRLAELQPAERPRRA